MSGPRPLRTAEAAAAYALSMVGRGVYRWGTGDVHSKDDDARDCWGFAFNECYLVPRHRPGFNRGWRDADGRTPSIEDDLNCNSGIEDADHAGELFRRVHVPMVGDLIAYPTLYPSTSKLSAVDVGRGAGFSKATMYGHVMIVVGLDRLETEVWDVNKPDWALLDTVQCCGPAEHRPGIVAGNGYDMTVRDRLVTDPRDRTALLRVRA